MNLWTICHHTYKKNPEKKHHLQELQKKIACTFCTTKFYTENTLYSSIQYSNQNSLYPAQDLSNKSAFYNIIKVVRFVVLYIK